MSGSQQPPPLPGPSDAARTEPGSAALEAPHRQWRLLALARCMDLSLHIEDLAEEWLAQVCGPELSRHEAVVALLAGLRGVLDDPCGPSAQGS